MEHIKLPQPERYITKDDDPCKVIVEQETKNRDAALGRMRKAEAEAMASQNIIEMIEAEIHTLTVVLEVDFLHYVHDIYTYSSSVEGTQQFSMRTDSLSEAVQAAARYINSEDFPKSSLEPELKSIGVAIGAASYQEVEEIDDLRKLFLSTSSEGKWSK